MTEGPDSIYRTVEVVGDAWSWLIMREAVLHDVRRFSQLQARLGVARSTLSARLDQLSRGGLLIEDSRSSAPEYRLTDSGRAFLGCLLVAMRWGDRWCAGEGSHLISGRHISCGQPLGAVLRCRVCHEIVDATGVTAHRPGSSAHWASLQRHRTPDLSLLERKGTSSIARTLAIIGDHWTSLIIREAFFGTRRFDDFQRNLCIAPNILSSRLRRLVAEQILFKSPYSDWPVRHEYRLTEKGRDLYHVPLAMLTWGQRWLPTSASDIQLVHRPCGQHLQAVLSCGRCGDPLGRADVDVE